MTTKQQACRLHEWYGDKFQTRHLPWRRHDEPSARVCMVEGLLAQTRADAVAKHYNTIFAGVRSFRDWLALPAEEHWARVAPLGLPRLKVAAMTSIARVLSETISSTDFSDPLFVATLTAMPGIGPYTAGMLSVLIGGEAIPIDANVLRVGGRVDADGDAERWMGEIIEGIRGASCLTGYHPFYEVTCAVLDLGATLCGRDVQRCAWCPIADGCSLEMNRTVHQQALFPDLLRSISGKRG